MNRIVVSLIPALGLSLAFVSLAWAAESNPGQGEAIAYIKTVLGGRVTVEERIAGKERHFCRFRVPLFPKSRRNPTPSFSRISTAHRCWAGTPEGINGPPVTKPEEHEG